jgi:MFS family permease
MTNSIFRSPSTSALSSKNFRIYLYGNIFSVLGIWVQRLALGWHAWQLSESTFVVGLVAAAQFLPLLILSPFFGVLADRIRPRSGAIVAHLVLAAIAAMLAVFTFTNSISINILFVLALLHGIANSAYSPIRMSLVPDLVPPRQFPSAVAISSVVFNLSRFLGPVMAGAIVTAYGLGYAYLVNAVTYIPVVVSLFLLQINDSRTDSSSGGSYYAQLVEGLRYTRDHDSIRQVILLVGVSNLFGRGIVELMPAYAVLVFDGGSRVLAALMSAAGLGAIITSILFSTGLVRMRLHASVVLGTIGVGVSLVLFSFVRELETGLLSLLLIGFFTTTVAIASQSEVQIHVENRLRGRVLSLWTILAIGGPAIGSLVGGAISGKVGASGTALIFAAACLILVLIVGIRRPAEAGLHKFEN